MVNNKLAIVILKQICFCGVVRCKSGEGLKLWLHVVLLVKFEV